MRRLRYTRDVNDERAESARRIAGRPGSRRPRTTSVRSAAVPVVIFAEPLAGRLLRLGFADGCEGEVDVAAVIGSFHGVFAPLSRQSYFGRVRVDSGLGTVWLTNAIRCHAAKGTIPERATETQRHGEEGERKPRKARKPRNIKGRKEEFQCCSPCLGVSVASFVFSTSSLMNVS